jgi:hypothetical protein
MENKPWLSYWLAAFQKDDANRNKRFKILNCGYPNFVLDTIHYDIVEVEEFNFIEDKRLPLFIGTQFGIVPKIENLHNFFNGEKEIAILGKSVLSGAVAGLSICKIESSDTSFSNKELVFYANTAPEI